MEQKYLTIEEQDNEILELLNSCVEVSEKNMLSQSNEIKFQAKLTLTDTKYKFIIEEESKYIVLTKSGEIYEYNMFDDFFYSETANTLSSGYQTSGTLKQMAFKDIKKISDIAYIKITDISLYDNASDVLIEDNLELELYSNK